MLPLRPPCYELLRSLRRSESITYTPFMAPKRNAPARDAVVRATCLGITSCVVRETFFFSCHIPLSSKAA